MTQSLIIQILMPVRQYLPEGDPSWHGVGHKFSWRMMLADKIGKLKVNVKLPNNPNYYQIKLEEYICARQGCCGFASQHPHKLY